MTRVLRRMGFSRQKARPSHPRRDAEAPLQKRGLRDRRPPRRHPDKRLQLWFQDRASATRAVSPVVAQGRALTRQIGYQWAYIFSAVRPDTGDDVTLVIERQRQGHGPVSRTLRRYPTRMRTPS